MLGLVMVVMVFAMVGCGTEDKNNAPSTEQTSSTEDKNNTSSTEQATNSEDIKVVVDGLTGEKVTIVEEQSEGQARRRAARRNSCLHICRVLQQGKRMRRY